MQRLKRRLPNLNALVCFEASGRYLSFTKAADELCVTQGAISRQIRELENALGVSLFRRRHRSVELTDDGRRYHHAVTVALEHLADATGDLVSKSAARRVTVAATTAISAYWLMPRLPNLNARFPDIEVQILASDTDLSTREDAFDIGIQFGHGRWPEFNPMFLCVGEVVPVCSPKFLGDKGPFPKPEDLLAQPLVHLDDERVDWVSWPAWFRIMGVEETCPAPALRVNNYTLMNKAVFEGNGIALGMVPLLDEQFERDWLTIACDFRMRTAFSFYLLAANPDRMTPDCRIVRDWIVEQFRT